MSDELREPVLAWHFLLEGGVTRDGQTVTVGSRLHVDPPLVLCERGLHASHRIIDALRYAPGPVVCRVRMSGEIVDGLDKLVATDREVVAMTDATNVLHEFACVVAEEALRKAGATDERLWNAIATKRRWLARDATYTELSAALEAANTDWGAAKAASAAARETAWEAAWWAACWATKVAASAGVERSRQDAILTRMVEEAL